MTLMRRMAATCLFMICIGTVKAQPLPWQDTSMSLNSRVEWLLKNLTLDEKLSLMEHHNPAIPRLGLPAYSWWNEALHGVGRAGQATVYPMPIALAATFNTELVKTVFGNVAVEAEVKYQQARDTGYYGDYSGLTFFTPNINILRDPRWGRGMETYGEDPFLTAMMGKACVEGLQGEHFKMNDEELLSAACLKHFAVHSGPEATRHEFDSQVSERDLWTTYLPAFEYVIKHSYVTQVMCGYNRLNGVPCCTNRRLFDILRKEWGYNGILVTDCWALNDTYEADTVVPRHGTHTTAAAAYGDAFGGEVDLECGSGLPAMREAVRQGLVTEDKVDEHVRRLLSVRLAATGYVGAVSEVEDLSPDYVASQSMVLLKNDGVLPLRGLPNIILAGPNAYDSLMPLGNYNGTPEHCVTIGEAFAEAQKKSLISSETPTVIYCGGLTPQLEGEELSVEREGFYKGDRTRIELPRDQVEEIKAFKAKGWRVVLVLCSGSAVALEEVIDHCDAVLVAWYGGQDMGEAVRRLFYGEDDNFGHLPVTFYRSTEQLPPFDDYAMQGRTYRYPASEPLFPFGYGLSYSFFQLYDLVVDEANFTVSGEVSMCNTDAPEAGEHRAVVQVYLKNEGDPDAPYKQLVGFNTIPFFKGERTRQLLYLELDPFWFRQFNPATGKMEEPADGTRFTLQVGFSSDDRDLFDFPFVYHNRK